MIDYHMHTTYSPDAEMTMEQAVARCKELGKTHMAFTDHHEFFPDKNNIMWQINDLHKYIADIENLQLNNPDITIAKGIELGVSPMAGDRIKKTLDTVDFDFVIASVHLIDGVDPYFPEYFKSKTKHDAYISYFEETMKCLDIMDDRTCVIGHIGYPARYASYDDNKMHYHETAEVIDAMLKKIISRGFGIEINTSNFGKALDDTMPPYNILKRYIDLGGEIITIGSDAHNVNDIGKGYNRARDILLSAGGKYICTFSNLQPQFIKL